MPTMVRGCGTRVKGGIYAEVPTGPEGKPVEFFLVDPPKIVNPDALGITAVGVKLMAVVESEERIGAKVSVVATSYHVVDWIGATHYPNVADFVEEVRRKGVSRRLPKTLDYSKLDERSRLILLHPRAYIGNFPDYLRVIPTWGEKNCPKGIDHHGHILQAGDPNEMCDGLWWFDVPETDVTWTGSTGVQRQFTDFVYDLPGARGKGMEPRYQPAIFASFPIVKLAVVRNPDDFKDEETALDLASKSRLPITLEDL